MDATYCLFLATQMSLAVSLDAELSFSHSSRRPGYTIIQNIASLRRAEQAEEGSTMSHPYQVLLDKIQDAQLSLESQTCRTPMLKQVLVNQTRLSGSSFCAVTQAGGPAIPEASRTPSCSGESATRQGGLYWMEVVTERFLLLIL